MKTTVTLSLVSAILVLIIAQLFGFTWIHGVLVLQIIAGLNWFYLWCFKPTWTFEPMTGVSGPSAVSVPKRWYRLAQVLIFPLWEIGFIFEVGCWHNSRLRESAYEII